MLVKATLLWVVGLLTLVPYGTYYLLFEAPREQYALLITLILFWIFGYWSLVGPLFMAVKVRSVFRAIESAGSKDELEKALRSPDARDVAIDFIATENHIPRFLAARVYALLITRMAQRIHAQSRGGGEPGGSHKQ
jgi:hypothetical protein